jgi:hypothetical protein
MPTADVYDEQAVEWIAKLEERLGRLHLERFPAFAAVLNALEYQVEEGEGHPSVVRRLNDALVTHASVHGWPAAVVKDITQTLGLLQSHVEARHTR